MLELGSCLAFVAAFRGVFSRRLSWRFSYEVAMSEQAANVLLPTGGAGGLALGAWALRRIGMPAERIGRRTVAFFLITSSVNFAAVSSPGSGSRSGCCPARSPARRGADPGAAAAGVLIAMALSPRVLEGARGGGRGRIRAALAGPRPPRRRRPRRDRAARRRVGRWSSSVRSATWRSTWSRWRCLRGARRRRPELGTFVLAYALGQLGGLIPLPGGVGGTDGGLIVAFGLLAEPGRDRRRPR